MRKKKHGWWLFSALISISSVQVNAETFCSTWSAEFNCSSSSPASTAQCFCKAIYDYNINGRTGYIPECGDLFVGSSTSYGQYWKYQDEDTYTKVEGIYGTDCTQDTCDGQTQYDVNNNKCGLDFDPKENLGGKCKSKSDNPIAGDPINIETGNVFQEETDYQSTAEHGLKYTRYYNSLNPGFGGKLGYGWTADYWQRIVDVDADTVEVHRSDNKTYSFNLINGKWTSNPNVIETLVELKDAGGNRTGWSLTLPNDSVEEYKYSGVINSYLVSITTRDGFVTQVQYELTTAEGGDGNSNTLDKVIDPFGREMTFTYSGILVQTMTDPTDKIYTYNYNASGELISVTYPDDTPVDSSDNPKRIYHYENSTYKYALTGITDENGTRIANFGYDSQGRGVFSESAGGARRIDIVYNKTGTRIVTDSQGQAQTYHLLSSFGVVKTTHIDGQPSPVCGGQYQDITYDANGFVSFRTDFNGNTTTYVHNARGLETSRTEAAGTPQEHTITTEWSPDFRLPTKITEPGKVITFTYDSQGRLLDRKETAQWKRSSNR